MLIAATTYIALAYIALLKMNFAYLILVLFIEVNSKSLNQCVLMAIPFSSGNNGHSVSVNVSTANYQDNLELIIFDSALKYESMILFMSNKFGGYFDTFEHPVNNQCGDVLGVVGDLDFKVASTVYNIAIRSNKSVIQAVSILSPNILPLENLGLPNVVDMNPLSHYIDAITSLIDRLDWTYIALITDSTNYQLYAAELLLKKLHSIPKVIVGPYLKLGLSDDDHIRALQQVEQYRTKVIIMMVSEEAACTLLKYALQHNFIWPEYAWIVYNIYSNKCVSDMEGVILLNKEQFYVNLKSKEWINAIKETINSENDCHTVITASRYLNLLYESVLAVALAEQLNFSEATFPGISGQVQIREGKRQSNVSIIQIQNFSEIEIGHYNPVSMEVYFTQEGGNPFEMVKFPRVTIIFKVYDGISDLHVRLVLSSFVVSIIFITIIFILFLYFRNEPEIKATSVSLSMSMFLGCYILLLYIPLLLVERQSPQFSSLADTICMWQAWFSALGLPFPLILATLIVKMLRIYVIFNHPIFNPYSCKKKLCSDGVLFMFVLLLTSPTIVVLTAWSCFDYHSDNWLVIPQKGYIEVYDRCLSNHTVIWLCLLVLNLFILIVAVIIVALKTSKVRYKQFRDAKATNIYVFILSYLTVMTLLYWYFFRSLELNVANKRNTEYTLYTGHILIAMSCQFTLFIPKLYPPVMRRLNRNAVKSKNVQKVMRK